MVEEELKDDVHISSKVSNLMLPSVDKMVLQSKKMKKSSSKKEIAFLSTLKFKKTPHEKVSIQNTLLKFASTNKKSHE